MHKEKKASPVSSHLEPQRELGGFISCLLCLPGPRPTPLCAQSSSAVPVSSHRAGYGHAGGLAEGRTLQLGNDTYSLASSLQGHLC